MKKYRIKYLRLFCNLYRNVKQKMFEFFDNKYLGIILCYTLYYLSSIIFIIPIIIFVIILTLLDIRIAKKNIKKNNEEFIKLAIKYKLLSDITESEN